MIITRLRVQNFRVHDDFGFLMSPETTVITGANGSGKTSLAEAIYIALRGTSFKGTDADVLKHAAEWYRIDVDIDDGTTRTVKYMPTLESNKKQFEIDEKRHYRLPAGKKYPVVLFEPDDLQLFGGSPARRRRFLDQLIANVEPGYTSTLSRYERSLKQRNAALKRGVSADNLFAWNVALSEYGEKIIAKRLEYIEKINQRLPSTYRKIAGTDDDVRVEYPFSSTANIQQFLLTHLEANTQKDTILGYTTVGPHRHDIEFQFNHGDTKRVASRGEVRSVILALKFIEVIIIEDILGQKPLIILDDVYSELDDIRRKLLTSYTDKYQTFITSVEHLDTDVDSIVLLQLQ